MVRSAIYSVPKRLYNVSPICVRSCSVTSAVAVTRAKALLIIVGDPLVLGLDPLWREYLNTVHAGGGWRGLPIPWDPEEPVDPDGGYDVDLRVRALDTADALAQRLLDEAELNPGEDQQFHEQEE